MALAAYSPDKSINVRTRFWIGSLSKPITAAAILRLQADGKLSVTDKISRFFRNVPKGKRDMTIHQLLTHSSGLPQAYRADRIADRDEAVRAILSLPIDQSKVGKFNYSSDGYTLLAAIIEIAGGTSFETYVRRHVMRPAGMNHSGFWPPHKGAKGFAKIASLPPGASAGPTWGFRGASGMYSTILDLKRFATGINEAE